VTGGIGKHIEYDAIVRNRMLRQLTSHDQRVGHLVAMARYSDLVMQKIQTNEPANSGVNQTDQLARYVQLADERWAIIQILLEQVSRSSK
jgi:hypothetical protein